MQRNAINAKTAENIKKCKNAANANVRKSME